MQHKAGRLQCIAHSGLSCSTKRLCSHKRQQDDTAEKSAVRARCHFAAQAKQAAQLTDHTKPGAGTCQSNLHQMWSGNGTVNMPQQV